jgi:hypothetical protein
MTDTAAVSSPLPSSFTQSILSLLANLPGQIDDHINVTVLETTVMGALISGGGLTGVITAILSNSARIFTNAHYAAQAVRLLSSAENLTTHQALAQYAKPAGMPSR